MTTEDKTENYIETLLNAVAASAGRINMDKHTEPLEPGEQPVVIIPEGYRSESLEKYLPQPVQVRQSVKHLTVDSFLNYWKEFSFSASVCFANQENMGFEGIIDYHSGSDYEAASWCLHRVCYQCPVSKEWELWIQNNGKGMTQTTFATFIEDNIVDIVENGPGTPSGARMLEVASGLEVHKKVAFKSAKRLDNGEVQFTYNEDINGTDKTGEMKIPREFWIGVPVFKGDMPFMVKARLRYRMNQGEIRFWYDLYRIDIILDEAFNDAYGRIAAVVGVEKMFMASSVISG